MATRMKNFMIPATAPWTMENVVPEQQLHRNIEEGEGHDDDDGDDDELAIRG